MTAFLATYRANQRRSSIGKRTVVPNVSLGGGSSGGNAIVGAVTGVLGFAKTWLIDRIIGGGLTALWGLIVNTSLSLWTFNWRQTDEQIDQQIESLKTSLFAIAGGTLGNALGWVTCGIVPGVVIAKFNPLMGAYILKEVGEEALDEFIGNLSALAIFSITSLIRASIMNGFKAGRKWLFTNPTPLKRRMAEIVGINYDSERDLYLSKKGGHWSFAQRAEDAIESIEDPGWQAFVEEFFEEFSESCIEAGFVVAMSAESYLAANRAENSRILGQERAVELQPDRSTNETIVLVGPEEPLKTQIMQVLTDHQVLDKRDIGTFVGQPVEDYVRVAPQSTRLIITMSTNQTPPWGNAAQNVTISIPNVKRSALDWERIKLAVGGSNGYTWGRFYANALLDTGRYIKVFAGTTSEAKDRVEALALLGDGVIRGITVGEETRTGERLLHPEIQKDPVRIYPAFVTIFNRKELLQATTNSGQRDLRTAKKYEMRQARLDLWGPSKPREWEDEVNELFTLGY